MQPSRLQLQQLRRQKKGFRLLNDQSCFGKSCSHQVMSWLASKRRISNSFDTANMEWHHFGPFKVDLRGILSFPAWMSFCTVAYWFLICWSNRKTISTSRKWDELFSPVAFYGTENWFIAVHIIFLSHFAGSCGLGDKWVPPLIRRSAVWSPVPPSGDMLMNPSARYKDNPRLSGLR